MKHWRECKTDAEKRKFVKETVREYFPSAREDDIGFQGAVVLIAGLVAGTNVENLTALTGYPREFVAHISFRARSARLWVNERVCYEHWFEGDSFKPMAILCDVMVRAS
jgi:hypothetical protein